MRRFELQEQQGPSISRNDELVAMTFRRCCRRRDAEEEPLAEYTFTNHQWGNLVSEFGGAGRSPANDWRSGARCPLNLDALVQRDVARSLAGASGWLDTARVTFIIDEIANKY